MLLSGPSQICQFPYNLKKNLHFPPEFFYLHHSRLSTLLTIPECYCNGPIYIYIYFRAVTCWNIPEILFCGLFQNFYILNNSRILTFWTISEFYILDQSRTFIFWTIQDYLHYGPFKNLYIWDHSRIFTLLTISECLPSGPFQNMSFRTVLELVSDVRYYQEGVR